MSNRINYTCNPNGKLFTDTFSDLRLNDPERFYPGNTLDVYFKGMQMGTVQVMAVRTIEYRQITDVLSYLTCGKPAAYQAALIKSWYENETVILPVTRLDHVVLQWTERNIESHAWQLTEWWRQTRTQQEIPQTQNSKQ